MENVTGFIGLLFELNVNHYRSFLLFLNANLLLQVFLNIIVILMIYGNYERMEIPFLKYSIDMKYLTFIVPFSLLMLWLQFGFQFDNTIETRIAGTDLLKRISACPCYWKNSCFTVTEDCVQLSVANNLFRDSRLLDGWFYLSIGDSSIFFDNEISAHVFMSITYCLLLSSTNANSVVVPIIFIMRGRSRWLASISIVSIIMLTMSHFLFYHGHQVNNLNGSNITQWIIIVLSVIVGLFFLLHDRWLHRKNSMKDGKD